MKLFLCTVFGRLCCFQVWWCFARKMYLQSPASIPHGPDWPLHFNDYFLSESILIVSHFTRRIVAGQDADSVDKMLFRIYLLQVYTDTDHLLFPCVLVASLLIWIQYLQGQKSRPLLILTIQRAPYFVALESHTKNIVKSQKSSLQILYSVIPVNSTNLSK